MSTSPASMNRAWWPPAAGDKLRGVQGPDEPEDPVLHVVAVFEHEGEARAVTAEWWPRRRRWHYEVRTVVDADVGLVRPDGTPRKRT